MHACECHKKAVFRGNSKGTKSVGKQEWHMQIHMLAAISEIFINELVG